MIVIIDSGIGNVRSVANAIDYLKFKFKISSNATDLEKADKLIFPGQGAFCDGMKALHNSQLLATLSEQVLQKGKPYLGICLGLQLLAEKGFEDGEYDGLGWIKGKVRKINTSEKLPHMGWNNVNPVGKNQLFAEMSDNPTFYFAHSYILDPVNKSIVTGSTTYGETFVTSININNIFGVQFHPEKSQKNGLQLLKNFLTMK